MIRFVCSKCGKRLRVDDKYAGKRAKCPGCGEPTVVPGEVATFTFRCESCGHGIKVPQRYAGRKGKCPKCKEPLVVPAVKEEPVEEAPAATITCSMCGRSISLAERATEEFVECPECGNYLDPASGEIVTPAKEAILAGAEKVPYEEPDRTTREPTAINRRLLFILSGITAVVIVVVIGLIVILKSLGSEPVERPQVPRPPRRVADAAPAPAEAPPVAEPIALPPVPAATPTSHVRFAPAAGTRRTMRVSTAFITSVEELGQQQKVTAFETFTFDLEAAPARADGTVPLTVTLAAVQIKSAMQDVTTAEFDSTVALDRKDGAGGLYTPFLGKPCTIDVSAQGEIVDSGLSELYRTVAEERVASEEVTFQQRGDQAIEPADQQLNAREDRVLAMQQQLEAFPAMSRDKVSSLLGELVVALPAGPLREGDRWSRPVVIGQVDRRLTMATIHTVTSIEEKVCTIRAEGLRSWDEAPLVQELDQIKISSELGGSCQATLTVDRQTGWLLRKEQKTTLTGRITTGALETTDQDTSMPVALEITTTVTTLE